MCWNMFKRNNNKKTSSGRWITFIICLTFAVTGVSYSRYITKTNMSDMARIAVFNVDATVYGTSQILDMKIGNTAAAVLDNHAGEVNVQCTFKVMTAGALPLDIKIYYTDNLGVRALIGENEATVDLKAGGLSEYEIEIKWDESKPRSYEYAGMIDFVRVIFQIEQTK